MLNAQLVNFNLSFKVMTKKDFNFDIIVFKFTGLFSNCTKHDFGVMKMFYVIIIDFWMELCGFLARSQP